MEKRPVRISLPSKGRLSEDAIRLLEDCGLKINKPNPRQYEATIPALPGLVVLFQRPGDIVVGVRDGSVDFGISGLDVIEERRGENGDVLILHDALNFGQCRLMMAVPENLNVRSMDDLKKYADSLKEDLRVATKFPNMTRKFLENAGIKARLISAEGTLETAPSIGYADVISDLVSSGQTLKDNRLIALEDGLIVDSQSALIANKDSLKNRPEALEYARQLLENFEAHLRGEENLAIFANMRGESMEEVARKINEETSLGGLQGPTISQLISKENKSNWFAVHIIVKKADLFKSIRELRSVGGSGVVVSEVKYIFEEEPPRYLAMLKALEK